MAIALEDLPIALRRARRASANRSPAGPPAGPPAGSSTAPPRPPPVNNPPSVAPKTPRRSSKRVRFSNPFPQAAPTLASSCTTGLTPLVRRTSVASPSSKRRRHSAAPHPAADRPPSLATACSALPASGHVSLLPLRQVLDGRIQRRIRRNGLSEELDRASQDRRRRRDALARDLDTLRADLKARDAEIHELRNATIIVDSDRIWDLEAQVEVLTNRLADEKKKLDGSASKSAAATLHSPVSIRTSSSDGGPAGRMGRMERVGDWTRLARDSFAPPEYQSLDALMDDDQVTIATEPNTDNGLDDDDPGRDRFRDTAMAGLVVCETPTRPPRSKNSFPTPPLTTRTTPTTSRSQSSSTMLPPTPTTPRHPNPLQCYSMPGAGGVQASFRERERQSMRREIESLHLELRKLSTTLNSYTTLTDRLSARISTALPPDQGASPSHDVERQLDSLLRLLGDRTAAVLHLTSTLGGLGFPGNDASEIITSLASGFRAARLELEYLTPGEITLPLTSHGAEVLDLLLSRLRELGRRAKEDEAVIDEYHSLELSLRQQLSARVDAMISLGSELARAQLLLDQKVCRVQELEVGIGRLKGALGGYVHDVGELEELVRQLETETKDALETQQVMEEAHIRRIGEKDSRLHMLEAQLSAARDLAATLDRQLVHANAQSEQALTERDARITGLTAELDRISRLLGSVQGTAGTLMRDSHLLKTKVRDERQRGRGVVDGMREQMVRVLSRGKELLTTPQKGQAAMPEEAEGEHAGKSLETPYTPTTPAVVIKPRSFDQVDCWGGRPKKRVDSGLGFAEDEII